MNETNLTQMVAQDKIASVMPFAGPWLQKAIDYNSVGYTLPDLYDNLVLGMMQLWATTGSDYRGFLITKVEPTQKGPVVHLVLAAGYNLSAWLPDLGIIEKWALDLGAIEIKVWGRMGWLKLLRPHGYKLETQVLHRRLDFEVQ